ncbi:MAG: ATP-dependent Clp protease proteolytic subunit [Armatimonadetes bacterium]|nr:ATP-dependent Clp protease proteolytic subunit [Armatimonadota bacterium]
MTLTSKDQDADALFAAAKEVGLEHKADVVLFNNPVTDQAATELHAQLESKAKSDNAVFLILATFGGDPHAAYQIGREFQLRYPKVILCIAGDCYSAGTLIALCAHELIIADRGKIGPVDVQLRKKDEIMEQLSGLTMGTAIEELQRKAGEAVIEIAIGLSLELRRSALGYLSFRTALDLSSNMVAHMYGEVFKQIDPMKLGEDAMALQIAKHYGTILSEKSGNLKYRAIDRLVEHYPSHECIIDREEASQLFENLRSPGPNEAKLLRELGSLATEARIKERDGILTIFPYEETVEKCSKTEEVHEEISEPHKSSKNGGDGTDKPRCEEVAGRGAGATGEGDPGAETQGASPN